jgi:exonuclease SbcD
MKILHTSDLHIGHTFFGIDRYDEYEKFFDWLRNLLEEKKVEILIVSGDIFDVYMPPAKALKQYFDFLSSLKNIKVIIAGGNHDSPNTLLAPKAILEKIDVEVISGSEDDFVKRIEFDDFDILAVSYLREGILNKLSDDITDSFKKIYVASDKPTIATGHLTVGNFKPGESERDIYIGKIEALSADIFENFKYTALGHIHRPQEIKKGVVYSGSPLQMNFDEDYSKKVVLIDTDDFTYEFIDVPKFRSFVRLKGNYDSVLREMENIEKESFVEIELDEIVDSVDIEKLRKEDVNVVKIKLPFAQITSESVDVDKITPESVIKNIFKDDEDLEEILKVIEELKAEDEN